MRAASNRERLFNYFCFRTQCLQNKAIEKLESNMSVERPGFTWHEQYYLQQRDRRQRALLQHQNFDFLFYLGWSGCFTQSKHNIMKVVQS